MKLRRPYPRRSRRGFAALTLVMIVSAVLTAMMLSWQAGLARDRLTGQADILAQAVAAEGFALHHWLHAERDKPGFAAPPAGDRRVLTPAETVGLAAHGASASWRALPRGWTIRPVLAGPDRVDGEQLPHGLVELSPSPDVINSPAWEALRAAVETRLGASSAPGQLVYRAADHARIDRAGVLRAPRAGFPPPSMAAGLELGGHAITGTGQMEADTGLLPRLAAPMPGEDLALDGALTATATLTVTGEAGLATLDARTGTLEAPLTTRRVRADRAGVAGAVVLTGPDLLACRRPEADLCGGGTLDLSGTTGTPDWNRLTVFGGAWADTATATGRARADRAFFDAASVTTLIVRRRFNCPTCPWMFH